ncbi:MAG: MMPL family transporter [Treponema sp.]|nr:MMPL family transporter [Treponema sp.]
MKLFDVNAIFRRAAEAQIKRRAPILAVTALVTIILCAGLFKFTTVYDKVLLGATQEQLEAEARFKQVFSTDSIMVLVTADDVFAPDVLEEIDVLGRRLEKEIRGSLPVQSLLTMAIPLGKDDEIEIRNPFGGIIPTDKAELDRIKEFFLSRISLVNTFVSDDAKETWLILPLQEIKDPQMERVKTARRIITEEAQKAKGVCSLYPVGFSYIDMEATEYNIHESIVRVSIGFVVMLVFLIVLVRSFRGVLVSLLASVFGIGSVLGASSYLNISADVGSMSLPLMLGMALSIGYSLHLINSFKRHFRLTGKRAQSVVNAVEETGWSMLFTDITTVASLVSFLFFKISSLRWSAGIAACIVISVYVYVMLLIPIAMSFGKDQEPQQDDGEEAGTTKVDRLFAKFGMGVVRKKALVSAVFIAVMLVLIPGIKRIAINMDILAMQGPKVPHIARLMEMLKCKLGSIYSFDVMIQLDPSDEDGFRDVQNLLKLDQLIDGMKDLRLVKVHDEKPRVLSACGMLKEMNRMFNGDDPSYYFIDTEDGVAAQSLTFYADNFSDYFDVDNDDFTLTRLHVELTAYDSKKLLDDADDIIKRAKEFFPGAKVYAIGSILDTARSDMTLIKIELKSILFSLLIIAVMMILAFADIRTGLIAMVPNVFPVLVLAGLMGYGGINLDLLTVIVMPLVLGLAVDDTIHLINHIKHEFMVTGSYAAATENSFRQIGKTMVMTTVILCAMFAVYLFCPMRFFVTTGMLSIVGMSSALLADYTLTPALICLVKPFGKEREVSA